MAIIDKKGFIRGCCGSVIYKKWREVNVITGRSGKKKQTPATRAAAHEFGLASATARMIRMSMTGTFHYADRAMPNRLTCRVLQAIQGHQTLRRLDRGLYQGELQRLQGFEFNSHSPLSTALPVHPELRRTPSGGILLHVPAFRKHQIKCPRAHCRYVLRCAVYSFNLRDCYSELLDYRDFAQSDTGGGHEELNWESGVELPAGTVIVVGLTLYARQKRHVGQEEQELNAEDWSPSCILSAFSTPEAADPEPRMNIRERQQHREAAGSKVLVYQNSGLADVLNKDLSKLRAALASNPLAEEARQRAKPPGWPDPVLGRIEG